MAKETFDKIDRKYALQCVRCLICGAQPGKKCTTENGIETLSHLKRLRTARDELLEGLELESEWTNKGV